MRLFFTRDKSFLERQDFCVYRQHVFLFSFRFLTVSYTCRILYNYFRGLNFRVLHFDSMFTKQCILFQSSNWKSGFWGLVTSVSKCLCRHPRLFTSTASSIYLGWSRELSTWEQFNHCLSHVSINARFHKWSPSKILFCINISICQGMILYLSIDKWQGWKSLSVLLLKEVLILTSFSLTK